MHNAIEVALAIRQAVDRASADLEVFPHPRRRQDGAGGVSRERLRRLPRSEVELGGGAAQPPGGRVLPRPDAHDAGLRHRRLRRHAVQGHAGEPLQHPAQQDLAKFRPAAVQHQQHAQRRRASDLACWWRSAARSTSAWPKAARMSASDVRGARQEPDDGCARTCRTSLTSTTPSGRMPERRTNEGRHPRRLLRGLRRRGLRIYPACRSGDRPASERTVPSWSPPTSSSRIRRVSRSWCPAR